MNDGWTRLFVVAGTAAVFAYLAAPYVRGEFGEIDRQLGNPEWGNRNHTGLTPYGFAAGAPSRFPAQASGIWRGGDQPQPGGYRRCFYDGSRLACDDQHDGPSSSWRR
jgi:hypothetical protein